MLPPDVNESLEGLECFPNLTRLELDENMITDLTPLAGLSRLTYLDLTDNSITDISALRGLAALEQLRLSTNQIVDISPLSELSRLTTLSLGDNAVTNIEPLRDMTQLHDLELSYNPDITDLGPIADMRDLELLGLSQVPVSDPSILQGKPAFTKLYLSHTGVGELDFLDSYTKLRVLDVSFNPITDIESLEALPLLEYVNLDGTEVVDLSPLVDNPGIGSGDYVWFQNAPAEACNAELQDPGRPGRHRPGLRPLNQ